MILAHFHHIRITFQTTIRHLKFFSGVVLLLLAVLPIPQACSATPTSGKLSDLAQRHGWPPCQRRVRTEYELLPLAFAAARLAGWDIRHHVVCLINEVIQAADAVSSSSSSPKLRHRRRPDRLRRLRLALADCLLELGEGELAEVVYEEAAAIAASAAPSIEDWHQLGWFPIGTGELDTDPVLAAFGGSLPAAVATGLLLPDSFDRLRLVTELGCSGSIDWTPVENVDPSNGVLRLTPGVAWAELVNALGSTAALEFQGWLIGAVYTVKEISKDKADADLFWSLACDGPASVTVDDALALAADRYMRGRALSPVAGRLLSRRRGVHLLAVRVRGKQAAAVSCRFVLSSKSSKSVASQLRVWPPNFLPDLLLTEAGGVKFLGGNEAPISLPLVSLRSSGPLQCRLEMGGNAAGFAVEQRKALPTWELAPGQLGFVSAKLLISDAKVIRDSCGRQSGAGSVSITLRVSCADSGPPQVVQAVLRCRSPAQSVLFTFVDHDGSVQRAAAIAPLECQSGGCTPASKTDQKKWPIVLSLHGTSIKPEDQADSHKFMEVGATSYTFGIAGAWLLAPSRHGAHNWEGPGALTAMRSVDALVEATAAGRLVAADPDRLVFLGHSMGGHGALVLATHWPDRAIGVASLSGWLRKEDYGDNNVWFRHDLSSWRVSPKLKSVLEAANAENYVDSHLSNIKVSWSGAYII